jgi:hypothetical protein
MFGRVLTFQYNALPPSSVQKLLKINKDEMSKLFSDRNLYLVYPKFVNFEVVIGLLNSKTL